MLFPFQLPNDEVIEIEAPTQEAAQKGLQNILESRKAEAAQRAAVEQTLARVDTSPTGQEPPRPLPLASVRGLPQEAAEIVRRAPFGTQEAPTRFTKLQNAAAQGIDIETGIDPRIRTAMGALDFDPDVRNQVLNAMVRSQLTNVPASVPVVFLDDSTGEPVYLRETEDGRLRPTLVNAAGFEGGDILAGLGSLPSVALEIGGAVGGGLAAASVSGGVGTAFGAAAGAAAGAATGIEARKLLAKAVGAPPEIVDMAEGAFREAMIAAGGELLFFGAFGTLTAIRNRTGGRILEADTLAKFEQELTENIAKIKRLEERTNQKFNPGVGELTGSSELLVAESTLRRQAKGPGAAILKIQEVETERATGEALRDIATQRVRSPNDPAFRSVEDTSAEVREIVDEPIALGREKIAGAQRKVDKFDEELDVASDRSRFVKVRDDAFAAKVEAKELSDKGWKLYRDEVEYNPRTRRSNIVLDNQGSTPISQVMSQIKKDANNGLLATVANAQEAFLKDAGFGDDAIRQLRQSGDATGLAAPTLDMRQLHFTLSHLKRQQRLAAKGVDPNGFRSEDYNTLIGAIEDQIQSGTLRRVNSGRAVNPEKAAQVKLAWGQANENTALMHEVFDSDNMRTLLRTRRVRTPEGKVLDMPDLPAGLVRKRLFAPDDARFLNEALDATGQNPQVKQALGEELEKAYRDTVIRNGKFSQGQHNKFMKEFEDHLDTLFPNGSSRIRDVSSFGRTVDKGDAALRNLQDNITKTYGKSVATLDSNNIAKEILSGRVSPEQTRSLMRLLEKKAPGLALHVRGSIQDEILGTTLKKGGQVANFDTLAKLLREQRSTMTAVFGRQYTKDMDLLLDVLKVTERTTFSKAAAQEAQAAWLQLARSVMGPLSRKQRFITSVNRLAARRAGGKALRILQDPENLRQFMKLRGLSPTTPRFVFGVSALGLMEYAPQATQDAFKELSRGRSFQEQLVPAVERFRDPAAFRPQ